MSMTSWWRRLHRRARVRQGSQGSSPGGGESVLHRRVEDLEDRTLLHAGVDHGGDGTGPGYTLQEHVHAELSIVLDGQPVDIPTGIGQAEPSGFTSPIHTHDPDGKLHVHTIDTNGDQVTDQPVHFVRLQDFFDTWQTNAGTAGNNPDAIFTETRLMDRTVDAGHAIRMYVNGQPREVDPDYVFHEGDAIVLSYESAGDAGAPLMDLLGDLTVEAGSPLHIPLIGLSDGHTDHEHELTFTAVTDDPQVTATVLTGNRSLRLEVADHGTMTFELFDGRAPRAAGRIAELAESGFYDGVTFHRVIDTFMIQGGDPTGTGSGGSTLGDFDDQFHVDLQHNRPGILSMAKSDDDTNDSQFFITEAATRQLDSNHTVFGQLVTGEDVRESISNVATDNFDRPEVPVVIRRAGVFRDTQNAVLMLKAPEGHSGPTTVTVTVSDEGGRSFERTFTATVTADGNNSNPFLADIDPVRLARYGSATVTLAVNDPDVSTDTVFLGREELTALGVSVPDSVIGLAYTVDAGTGELTVIASNNLMGDFEIAVGVRDTDALNNGGHGGVDMQVVPVTIGVESVDAGDAAGDGTADTWVVAKTGSTITVTINGNEALSIEDTDLHVLELIGSSDDDIFQVVHGGANPVPAGGLDIDGGPQPGEASDSLEISGATSDNVRHQFDNATDGKIEYDLVEVRYKGIEPITDQLTALTREFDFGPGDNTVTLSDDGDSANDISRLHRDPAASTLDFRNPVNSLEIDLAGGNDSLVVQGLDPVYAPDLSILGGGGHDTLSAASADVPVSFVGGSGNDFLTGGSADDRLNGQAGRDTLVGGAGDDALLGGAGADLIDGGAGSDRARAQGASGDTIVAGAGNDLLDGGAGIDRLEASGDVDMALADDSLVTGGDTHLLANFERARLVGGPGSNTINASGFSGNTTLSGGAGDDVLTGSSGTTLLHEVADADLTLTDGQLTGLGQDTLLAIDRARLVGGPGANRLDSSGFSGMTTLRGSAGDDTLTGSNQADLILGGNGADSITAGEGNDVIRGGSGADTVHCGDGDDLVQGAGGDDLVFGDDGNDAISGATGRDKLNGGAGNDTLLAGRGDDTILGGGGDDLVLAGDGNDRVDGQSGNDTVTGNDGNDVVFDDEVEVDDAYVFLASWIDTL